MTSYKIWARSIEKKKGRLMRGCFFTIKWGIIIITGAGCITYFFKGIFR